MSNPKGDAGSSTDEQTAIENLKDSEVPSYYVDALITLGFLVGTAIFLYLSTDLTGMRSNKFDPGTAFWPRVALLAVAIAAIINAVFLFYRLREAGPVIPSVERISDSVRDAVSGMSEEEQMFYLSIISVTLYLAALKPTGFVFSTPLFLFAFAWIAGYRQPAKLVVFSLATTVFLFGAFRTVMNIALPYGDGIFRELSLFVEIAFNSVLP